MTVPAAFALLLVPQAAMRIFTNVNNSLQQQWSTDLHGLRPHEALRQLEEQLHKLSIMGGAHLCSSRFMCHACAHRPKCKRAYLSCVFVPYVRAQRVSVRYPAGSTGLHKPPASHAHPPVWLSGHVKWTIITGKGLHSDQALGPVLPTTVAEWLARKRLQAVAMPGHYEVHLTPELFERLAADAAGGGQAGAGGGQAGANG